MNMSELDVFYRQNTGLIMSVARKGHARLNAIGSTVDLDDIVQELSVVFVKAYRLHDESKGKFSTYFMSAAYHFLNRYISNVEQERIQHGVRSACEFDNGEEDDFDIFETVSSGINQPELAAEAMGLVAALTTGLSPLAKRLVMFTVSPPDIFKREVEARAAYAEFARSMGIERRSREFNIGFVCELFELAGVSRSAIKTARLEVERVIERYV